MIKIAGILAVVFIVLNLCAVHLRADIITIQLTAEVTHLVDFLDLFEGKIKIGDIITGSYTYDSETPDSNPFNSLGEYWHFSPPYGVSLSAGGFVFETDPDNVSFLVGISNNHLFTTKDSYWFVSYNNLPLSNGVSIYAFSWQLEDYTGTAVSDVALLTTPPVLEDWGGNYLSLAFGDRGDSTLQARVTNVIPEPATFLLLALGSLFLAGRRQYNRR